MIACGHGGADWVRNVQIWSKIWKKIAVLNETRQEMLAGLEREQPRTVEQEGPVRRKLKQQLLRNTERRR